MANRMFLDSFSVVRAVKADASLSTSTPLLPENDVEKSESDASHAYTFPPYDSKQAQASEEQCDEERDTFCNEEAKQTIKLVRQHTMDIYRALRDTRPHLPRSNSLLVSRPTITPTEILEEVKKTPTSDIPEEVWKAPTSEIPEAVRKTPRSNIQGLMSVSHTTDVAPLPAYRFLGIYLIAGTVWLIIFNSQISGTKTNVYVDSIYFWVVTLTTVGYGDLEPSGTTTKLFTCLFVFFGFLVVDHLLTAAASYFVRKQEALVNQLIVETHPLQRQKAFKHEILGAKGSLWDFVPLFRFIVKPEVHNLSPEYQIHMSTMRVYFALINVVLLIIVGVLVLHLWEGLSIIDAFYCACVTITTVGYGDNSFSSLEGRIFAIFWILCGTVIVAHFFMVLTELRMIRNQQEMATSMLKSISQGDIDEADMDLNGRVSLEEFILFKLKQMGKYNNSDLYAIHRAFQKLDVDNDNDLDEDDLKRHSGNVS